MVEVIYFLPVNLITRVWVWFDRVGHKRGRSNLKTYRKINHGSGFWFVSSVFVPTKETYLLSSKENHL